MNVVLFAIMIIIKTRPIGFSRKRFFGLYVVLRVLLGLLMRESPTIREW